MLKKILHNQVLQFANKPENKDITIVYLIHAVLLLGITLILGGFAIYLSWINAQETMLAAQAIIIFALTLGALQVFVRFLDIIFEAIKYENGKDSSCQKIK